MRIMASIFDGWRGFSLGMEPGVRRASASPGAHRGGSRASGQRIKERRGR